MRSGLIYIVLGLLFSGNFAYAQQSQLEVYTGLLQQIRERLPEGVSAVAGDTLVGVPLGLLLQKDKPIFDIDFPEIAYTRLNKDEARRQVLINYSLKDSSSSRGSSVQFSDTLHIETLKQIRREAPRGMRGGAITGTGKLLRAAGLVVGGIGFVLILFRLRS